MSDRLTAWVPACYLVLACFSVLSTVPVGASTSTMESNVRKRNLDDKADEPTFSISATKAQISGCRPEDGMAFHHRTHQCHKVFTRGPCGELQIFYRNKATHRLGRCSCIFNDDGCNARRLKSEPAHINRPLLMAPDRKRCYYAFSQGPCPKGQWYVLDSAKRVPVCQPNPCDLSLGPVLSNEKVEKSIKNRDVDVFWFSVGGRCHQTFTKGYCGDKEFVRFWGTDPRPSCVLESHPTRSCVIRPRTSTTTGRCGVPGARCTKNKGDLVLSEGTDGVSKCDSGFILIGRRCMPYGVFEKGFTGTVPTGGTTPTGGGQTEGNDFETDDDAAQLLSVTAMDEEDDIVTPDKKKRSLNLEKRESGNEDSGSIHLLSITPEDDEDILVDVDKWPDENSDEQPFTLPGRLSNGKRPVIQEGVGDGDLNLLSFANDDEDIVADIENADGSSEEATPASPQSPRPHPSSAGKRRRILIDIAKK